MMYGLCFLLFTIGLRRDSGAQQNKRNPNKIRKKYYAWAVVLIMLGFRFGGTAPIVDRSSLNLEGGLTQQFISASVDPLPQALVLTSIVIGLGTLALLVSICVRTYEKYGTFDITKIRRLQG